MPIPHELASACADVTSASAEDTVAGCRPRYVAAPASTEEASELLRAADQLSLTVVPRGAGRLQHWGSPPERCDLVVDTRRLTRVIEFRPDDLTVTVQAGVRLPDLELVLEDADRTLALLPPRQAWDSTVGGLIATNAAGPSRYRQGTPRDRLTGITAVRADGTIIRSAQANPKTAGQDLLAIFPGSYGTLGLITEATFRVGLRPQAAGGVWLPFTDPEHAAQLVEMVSDPSMAPSGIDLRWRAGGPMGLKVLVQGELQDVQAKSKRLHALAGRPAPPQIDRPRLRDLPDRGGRQTRVAQERPAERGQIHANHLAPPLDPGTLVQVSFPPGQLAGTLTVIQAAAADSGVAASIDGSAGAGVLDVEIPSDSQAAAVAQFVSDLRETIGTLRSAGTMPDIPRAVVLHAPDEVRNLTDMQGPVPSLSLMRAIKDQLDPDHRMAPGRLAQAT